jgi:outer membrane protein OmpA-like peptidoglycan-associated protein
VIKFKLILAIAVLLIAAAPAGATQIQQRGKQPIYTITINVVDRTTTAINYRHRSSATKIDFRGTPLMPAANGDAKVESKQGFIEINADFRNLQSATRFGPEFLTYVMWTITPEGRAANVGEVILNGTNSKLDVTTELQAFGLVVTAEPYFGVTQPSDVVVMENFVRQDTVGKVEQIDAKYELLQRGQYTLNVTPADLKPIQLDKNTPLDLYEARNAVRIAKWAGADVSAADSFEKARKLLDQAEAYKARKAGDKPVSMTAREAVQTAEDARLITLKSQADARIEQERSASAGREATANADAAGARADARDAERDRAAAQAQADRTRSDAQAAAQRATDDARAQAERTRLDTLATAQRSADEAKAQADRSKIDADLASQRAAVDKDAVEVANQLAMKNAADKSEREKKELRAKLALQLNTILQTQDTARGLVVHMSDVLFNTGQYSLLPGAREKLAKISGIVLAYPTLRLEVEGHTDSVGTDQLNMTLSENRAGSVRDFLIQEGMATTSIASRGFGKTQPVATNDTSAGRQQNRRVELVVSGDVIGNSVGSEVEAK